MDYQSYEDYARDVLGHQNIGNSMGDPPFDNMGNMNYNTYMTMPEDEFYEMPMTYNARAEEDNMSELNELYPEIYRIVYPMVRKICEQNMGRRITKDTLDEMVNEIYRNVEPEETAAAPQAPPGNTMTRPQMRPQNTKDPEATNETRHKNFLIDDLIRILILREFLRPGRRPFFRPPIVGPIIPGRPPVIRPPLRPRGYDGIY